ncbi:hypothetical protein AX15_000570 [Amanita polypyramis BW_CC]|nr:hypothetical protein AX15_000570 [Amanita polypyramis BW_CC]
MRFDYVSCALTLPRMQHSQTEVKAAIDAQKPFDRDADADVILRSSDSVDFFVIKLLLCFVSSVFRDIFSSYRSVNPTDNETRNGLPVVSLEEDSRTIRHLLLFIYPFVDEPAIHDAGLCMKLGEMAQKYSMNVIKRKVQRAVNASPLMRTEAFRMYTIAVYLNWNEIADTAASRTFFTSLNSLPYVDELQKISGLNFYHFLLYRSKRKPFDKSTEVVDLVKESTLLRKPSSDNKGPGSAEKPFDATSGGDLILRSSDNTDFFVLKALVCMTSPVLTGLIEQADTEGGPKLIALEEDSRTIYHLLMIMYHSITMTGIQDYRLYFDVGKASKKYKMERIEATLKDLLTRSNIMAQSAFKVYVIASALGWNEIAKLAASRTLDTPFEDMKYGDELNDINGAGLFRFMQYRFRCADVACQLLAETNKFQLQNEAPSIYSLLHGITNITFSGFGNPNSTYPSVPNWFVNYVRGVNKKLQLRPQGATVMEDADLQEAVAASEEEICNDSSRNNGETAKEPKRSKYTIVKLLECRKAVAAAIDEAVSKVSSTLLVSVTCDSRLL